MPFDPESNAQTETHDPMTLAQLRLFVEGLDVARGHDRAVRSAARTLLACNAQNDGLSPQEEAEVEVEVAIFGLLYCFKYLCAAFKIDLEDLVAMAHDCYVINKTCLPSTWHSTNDPASRRRQ